MRGNVTPPSAVSEYGTRVWVLGRGAMKAGIIVLVELLLTTVLWWWRTTMNGGTPDHVWMINAFAL
jgi:hypothetical protein